MVSAMDRRVLFTSVIWSGLLYIHTYISSYVNRVCKLFNPILGEKIRIFVTQFIHILGIFSISCQSKVLRYLVRSSRRSAAASNSNGAEAVSFPPLYEVYW